MQTETNNSERHISPTDKIGFEIVTSENKSFAPKYYPDSFTQVKKKKFNRYGGGGCGGESVSIKTIKNRELHAKGVMLQGYIDMFHHLMDHDDTITIYSPITPSGGFECYIKSAELGDYEGYDPHAHGRLFEYTLDLVSTGRDEYRNNENQIVSSIIDNQEDFDPIERDTPDYIENKT